MSSITAGIAVEVGVDNAGEETNVDCAAASALEMSADAS